MPRRKEPDYTTPVVKGQLPLFRWARAKPVVEPEERDEGQPAEPADPSLARIEELPPSPVRNAMKLLRRCQLAKRSGQAVSLTTDPEWLVDMAVNRRGG